VCIAESHSQNVSLLARGIEVVTSKGAEVHNAYVQSKENKGNSSQNDQVKAEHLGLEAETTKYLSNSKNARQV
jgi:hypothetical protein